MDEIDLLPLITIGITAYNAEDTIESAVRSAMAQDWDSLEIVVVNDASTDGTREIVDRLNNEHDALRVFHLEENGGVAAARNKIIEEAKGVFLAFFDDDDVSKPERLKEQYLRIYNYEEEQHVQQDIVCYTARVQHYPDGSKHYEPTAGADEDAPCPRGEAVAKRILYGFPVENGFGSMASCSMMARLSAFQRLDGFDEAFRRCEDTDFNIRFALQGGHFTGIASPLVEQKMTRGSEKTIDEEETFYKKLIVKHGLFIRNCGVRPRFCYKWLEAKYAYLRGQKMRFIVQMAALGVRHPVLTFQRLRWALPNKKFNDHAREFYKGFS